MMATNGPVRPVRGRWGLLLGALLLGAACASSASAQGFMDRLKGAAEKAVEKKTEQVMDDALSDQPPAAQPEPAPRFEMPKLKVGNQKASGGRNCGALGAGCADGMNDLMACMERRKGNHFGKLLAPALQRKLDAGVFAAGSRAELEYDLRAVEAAAVPPYELMPADAARPHRYLDWLTPQEQADIMNESNRYAAVLQKACNEKYARF